MLEALVEVLEEAEEGLTVVVAVVEAVGEVVAVVTEMVTAVVTGFVPMRAVKTKTLLGGMSAIAAKYHALRAWGVVMMVVSVEVVVAVVEEVALTVAVEEVEGDLAEDVEGLEVTEVIVEVVVDSVVEEGETVGEEWVEMSDTSHTEHLCCIIIVHSRHGCEHWQQWVQRIPSKSCTKIDR